MNRHVAAEIESYWQIRAANYDKLYWTKDSTYLSEIVRLAELQKEHVVLDVGTGTGTLAVAVKDLVHHVVAIDISDAMLEHGDWKGISVIRWHIGETLFADGIFDRLFARMVFHHILDDLESAIRCCYNSLKEGGKIIVAEGVPPVNDTDVIAWYTEMFKLKEDRTTFTPEALVSYLINGQFKNVTAHVHYTKNFSIRNWVKNSGLDKKTQRRIMNAHRLAPPKIRQAYNMRMTRDDCIVRTKNSIIVAEK